MISGCSIAPVNNVCVDGKSSCKPYGRSKDLNSRQITVSFREDLLGTDAVRVWPTVPNTEGLALVGWYVARSIAPFVRVSHEQVMADDCL